MSVATIRWIALAFGIGHVGTATYLYLVYFPSMYFFEAVSISQSEYVPLIINICITLSMIAYNIYQCCKLNIIICKSSHFVALEETVSIIKSISILFTVFVINWTILYIQGFHILLFVDYSWWVAPFTVFGSIIFSVIGIEVSTVRQSILTPCNKKDSLFIFSGLLFILFWLRWCSISTVGVCLSSLLFDSFTYEYWYQCC